MSSRLALMLVQEHMDHREQKCRVGLWLDRNPFRRARAGYREVRLNLNAFHAPLASIGVPLHATHTAGRFDVGAEGNKILAKRRVRRNRKAPVPQFAIEMLGVVALHALPRAKAHVDRTPRCQERGQRSHVGRWRAAPAEARGNARISCFVGKASRPYCIELVGDER